MKSSGTKPACLPPSQAPHGTKAGLGGRTHGRAQKSPSFFQSWDWAQKTRTALLTQQLTVPQVPLLDPPSLVCPEAQGQE